MDLRGLIRDVPDFPEDGVMFRDISPLLNEPTAVHACVERMAQMGRGLGVTKVAAIESRGFLFGVPVAMRLGAGFVPIRKPGKLPCATSSVDYKLEYGSGALEMHTDAIAPDDRVLLIDDVLATGGTMQAAHQLVMQAGGVVVGCAFLIELADLRGREKLNNVDVFRVLVL